MSCVMVDCLITKPQPVYPQYIKNLTGLLGIAGNFRDMAVIAISCYDKGTNCAINITFQFCRHNSGKNVNRKGVTSQIKTPKL